MNACLAVISSHLLSGASLPHKRFIIYIINILNQLKVITTNIIYIQRDD